MHTTPRRLREIVNHSDGPLNPRSSRLYTDDRHLGEARGTASFRAVPPPLRTDKLFYQVPEISTERLSQARLKTALRLPFLPLQVLLKPGVGVPPRIPGGHGMIRRALVAEKPRSAPPPTGYAWRPRSEGRHLTLQVAPTHRPRSSIRGLVSLARHQGELWPPRALDRRGDTLEVRQPIARRRAPIDAALTYEG